jgi:NCS1 family nucleobase:cation symporter-1
MLRILLGMVGFAVQSWNGGLCATAVLGAIFPAFYNMRNTIPASSHLTTAQLVGWLVFLLICLPLIYVRPERAPKLMVVMNSLTLVTLLSITIWSLSAAHGGGPLLSQPAIISGSSMTGWAVVGGINNVIGTVAPALSTFPLLISVAQIGANRTAF